MAGIEPNPGPRIWICNICNKKINKTQYSICCHICYKWCHLDNCSTKINKHYHCNLCPHNTLNLLPTMPNRLKAHPSPIITQPPKLLPTITLNTNTTTSKLKILQFNCNGIRNKQDELEHHLITNNIHIAAIQESKLTYSAKDPKFNNYTIYRKDRQTGKGGGLVMLIHQTIPFSILKLPDSNIMEHQAITIKANNSDLNIINIYIPPQSSCPSTFKASISNLLAIPNILLIGDLNAHDLLWQSNIQDSRGADLATEIDNSNCGTLNLDTPTRIPTTGQPTSPDISIASDTFINSMEWSTSATLSSDHLPIHITLQTEYEASTTPKISFTNFNKADWDNYTAETETAFKNTTYPSNISTAEKIFRHILLTASKHNIPTGRHISSKPGLSKEITNLIQERDLLRNNDPQNNNIPQLNDTINNKIQQLKRNRWMEYLSTFNRHTNIKRLWTTIKALNGKPHQQPNNAINFNNKPISNNTKLANLFNKLFSSFTRHITNNLNRITTRQTKKLSLIDTPQLTTAEVSTAIKQSRPSKAAGPDKLTIFHLKYLGPNGINFLTNIFNTSLITCKIPDIYKTAKIIPLLKPGKPDNDAKSYRPISLLCPAIKVMEKCLLPLITKHLLLAQHQHGFRPGHSTATALTLLTTDISTGFNQKQPAHRTIITALDLTKAFDTVNHRILINDLINSTLPPSLTRWLSNYLHGRLTSTEFRNQQSKYRIVHTGVPQGSVLSPALFNYYVSKAPLPPPNINIISYADDFTIYTTGPKIDLLTQELNKYLPLLINFFNNRNLEISPAKSTVTLITPQTAQYNHHPQIKINDQLLPLEHNPKLLGITFDTMLTFTTHHKTTAAKASKRNNILKALSGTSYGQDKETLIQTYKAISRPIIEYASPSWTPLTSTSNLKRLQTTQNAALRTITGCHNTTSEQHLHSECQMLTIDQHTNLLSSQFLLQCYDPEHPCHRITTTQYRPRNMKQTLPSSYSKTVQPVLPDTFNNNNIKTAMKTLHTTAAQSAIFSYHAKVLINGWPPPTPPIHKSESTLHRSTRRTLAQLRSGHCILLNSYKSRINTDISNKCPFCDHQPDDVQHLFNCSNNPTQLKTIDLWRNPTAVARWLSPRLDQ